MQCLRPLQTTHGVAKCGQCMPCRIAFRRMWTGKLLCESQEHAASSFITLTYNDENVPIREGLQTLYRPHAVDFKESLRTVQGLKKSQFRYFMVGEYGEESLRPHYHLLCFGLDAAGAELLSRTFWRDPDTHKPLGHIQSRQATPERMAYCAAYTTKKLTREKLNDRYPEFTIKSNRPSLGASVAKRTVDYLNTPDGKKYIQANGDIPEAYRTNGQHFPWSQYEKRKIRKLVGLPEKTTDLVQQFPQKEPPPPFPTVEEMRDRWRTYYVKETRRKILTGQTAKI